ATWDTTCYDNTLPDPVNQGATLSWKKGNKYILAVSNAADQQHRHNLTLRVPKDQGKTWYSNQVAAKDTDGYEGSYAAYSDIVLIKKNRIGGIYEKDNYKEIVFVPVKIK